MSKPLEILTPTEPWAKFAGEYFALRQKEWRLPDDDLLAKLPYAPSDHPHASAWKMRKQGMEKLLGVIKRYVKPNAPVLDIGCGNGWMSSRIAEAGFQVTAIDVNLAELEQANRVFSRPGMRFAFADLFVWQPDEAFQAAVLSSAIQYFEEPRKLLAHLFAVNPQLKTVIISDSPFYSAAEKTAAAQRSRQYYSEMGYPEMAAIYHHHSLEDLGHPYKIEYQPINQFIRKLIGGVPFPIIAVSSSR